MKRSLIICFISFHYISGGGGEVVGAIVSSSPGSGNTQQRQTTTMTDAYLNNSNAVASPESPSGPNVAGAAGPGGAGGPPAGPFGGGGGQSQEKKPARRIGAKPPPDRAPRSIYCFSVKNPLRKKFLEIVEWKAFEFLILVTILGNCVALAVYTPFPAEDTNETNLILVSHVMWVK